MTVNELRFGNLTKEHLSLFNEHNYLDSLLSELTIHSYPENESDIAQQELATILNLSNNIGKNQEQLNRYLEYDKDVKAYLMQLLDKSDILSFDLQQILNDVERDATPLLMKVKYHYQRIRPIQLSYYAQSGLQPYKSVSSDSPAYPSGHTYLSKLYCEVVGNRFPKYYKQLTEVANDVAWSRLYLGLHYPSDCDFGVYMADTVLSNTDFKKKYKL